MSADLRLPNISAQDTAGQVTQMRSYLYQMVQELNWALGAVEAGAANAVAQQLVGKAVSSASSGGSTEKGPLQIFNSIKDLIIKSADIVSAYYDVMKVQLDGQYVAQSTYGTFAEQTQQQIEANSTGIQQNFTNIQAVEVNVSGMRTDITGLETDLSWMSKDVSDIQADMETVSQSLSGVQEDLSGVQEELSGVNETLSSVQADLSGLDEDLGGMFTTIEGVQEELSGMGESVSGVMEDLSGVQSNILGMQETITDVQGDLSGAQETIAGVQTTISGVQEDLSGAQDTIAGMEGDLNELGSGLADLENTLAGVERILVGVKAYINSGLLYYDSYGIPVYGIEVGQRTQVNGQEIFNKYARFTANKLSFYDANDSEVAYISDYHLYITNVRVTGSFRLGHLADTVQSDGSVVTKYVREA